MPARPEDQRRLAFGRVAELYDEARPGYPAAAIDAILAAAPLAPGGRIYEVGAGTGKATVLFAVRGYHVTAIEPSAEMARVARARCARYPGVEIVECDFEQWHAPERRGLVVSAQAWHWVDPTVGFRRASEALLGGGTLVAMWNFPDWPRCTLQSEMSAVYRSQLPELQPDFPMHPDSRPERLDAWRAGTHSSQWFDDPHVAGFGWTQRYTTEEYIRLMHTHQDHILMEPVQRGPLLDAIGATIERAGGGFELPLVTWVCTLTRR